MEVAVFGRAAEIFAARRSRYITSSRSQSFENWIKPLYRFFRAANHHAVAAVDSPNSAAGADVDVMDALALKLFRAAHVIFEVRITTVNDCISSLEILRNSLNCRLGRSSSGNHGPHCAGRVELGDEILDRRRSDRTFTTESFDRFRASIGNHYRMPAAREAARHVSTHAPETNHSQLHLLLLAV